jgi:hypothetical protein
MKQNLRLAFLLLTLSVFVAGCKKDNPYNNTHAVPTSGYYFQGTFGGTFNQITTGAGGASSSGYAGNAGQDYNYNGGGAFINYSNLSNPITLASVNIQHYYYNTNPSTYTLDSLFLVSASVPFTTAGNNPANGVYVTWMDANGHNWASNNAPGTQSGSKFTITASSAIDPTTYMATVTGTFNCILYDSVGNSLIVTGGAFKSYALLE